VDIQNEHSSRQPGPFGPAKNKVVSFTFNGKHLRGFEGSDTLARCWPMIRWRSVGRSNHHRPRGVVASGPRKNPMWSGGHRQKVPFEQTSVLQLTELLKV
jgi:sarcosine oxidase subunit alpha